MLYFSLPILIFNLLKSIFIFLCPASICNFHRCNVFNSIFSYINSFIDITNFLSLSNHLLLNRLKLLLLSLFKNFINLIHPIMNILRQILHLLSHRLNIILQSQRIIIIILIQHQTLSNRLKTLLHLYNFILQIMRLRIKIIHPLQNLLQHRCIHHPIRLEHPARVKFLRLA